MSENQIAINWTDGRPDLLLHFSTLLKVFLAGENSAFRENEISYFPSLAMDGLPSYLVCHGCLRRWRQSGPTDATPRRPHEKARQTEMQRSLFHLEVKAQFLIPMILKTAEFTKFASISKPKHIVLVLLVILQM